MTLFDEPIVWYSLTVVSLANQTTNKFLVPFSWEKLGGYLHSGIKADSRVHYYSNYIEKTQICLCRVVSGRESNARPYHLPAVICPLPKIDDNTILVGRCRLCAFLIRCNSA